MNPQSETIKSNNRMRNEFQFVYPLKDSRFKDHSNFTDLTVIGEAITGELDKAFEVKVNRVIYFRKHETLGSDVAGLIQVLNMDLFMEISTAAESYVLTNILKPQ